MAWNVIRKAKEEDLERLYKSARRFCDRHHIGYDVELSDYVAAVEDHIAYLISPGIGDVEHEQGMYLDRLWYGCTQRALKTPGAEGIAWNTVGYSTKD